MRIRTMTSADIPAGMRLKEISGWNQTADDWQRFLDASHQGCFVWVGMVLVDPAHRGQGIGTALLEKAIAYLDAAGIPAIKLDATPAGKPIYQKLGFLSEYEIERWVLRRTPQGLAATGELPPDQGPPPPL